MKTKISTETILAFIDGAHADQLDRIRTAVGEKKQALALLSEWRTAAASRGMSLERVMSFMPKTPAVMESKPMLRPYKAICANANDNRAFKSLMACYKYARKNSGYVLDKRTNKTVGTSYLKNASASGFARLPL